MTHSLSSPRSGVSLPEVCLHIAQGVRTHRRIRLNMGSDTDDLEISQVALQVLNSIHPESSSWDGTTTRAFLVECGISPGFAKSLVHDSDPLGIY